MVLFDLYLLIYRLKLFFSLSPFQTRLNTKLYHRKMSSVQEQNSKQRSINDRISTMKSKRLSLQKSHTHKLYGKTMMKKEMPFWLWLQSSSEMGLIKMKHSKRLKPLSNQIRLTMMKFLFLSSFLFFLFSFFSLYLNL